MSDRLDLVESPVVHSSSDELVYSTDTEEYGGSPTDIEFVATNLTTGQVVTAQVLSGSHTLSGDVITWPTILNLIKGCLYAIDILFTCSSNRVRRRLKIEVGF